MTTDELAAELERVRAKAGGELTPDAVVRAAASPDHPLHDRFTWDDTAAAVSWRRQQARVLIASVQVIIQRTTARGVRDVSVRRYASTVRHDRRQYVPVSEIELDPEMSAMVLAEINVQLASLRRKYQAYGALFAEALASQLEDAA